MYLIGDSAWLRCSDVPVSSNASTSCNVLHSDGTRALKNCSGTQTRCALASSLLLSVLLTILPETHAKYIMCCDDI